MINSRGLLVVISAPGGAGKGTLIKKYLEMNKNIKLSISCTSRPKRTDDSERSYYFLERSQFEEMIRNDELFEYVEFCGNYYGTPKKFIMDNVNRKNDVILELDYVGALTIKQKFPQAVIIFILPPSVNILRKRLEIRGSDSFDRIAERLTKAKEEAANAKKFDYLVINDNIDDTLQIIDSIISFEKNSSICTEAVKKIARASKVDTIDNLVFIDKFISELDNI